MDDETRIRARRAYLEWLESLAWTFAKTYADSAPHEYVVRDDLNSKAEVMFESLVTHIRAFGYDEMFRGRKYTCLDLGGEKYWTMGNPVKETTVLNRRSYDGYDVLTELHQLGVDPAEYVDVANYTRGEKTGGARPPPVQ